MILLQYEDYNIKGYHKKKTRDTKGDIVSIEYYANYDGTTYNELKVRETRVYHRDIVTGLLSKRDVTIEWIDEQGAVMVTKLDEKFYTAEEGYAQNQRARQYLVNQASMYIYSILAEDDAKDFRRLLSTEISEYVAGDIDPLIDAIAASNKPYLTVEIQTTLDVILNVVYSG